MGMLKLSLILIPLLILFQSCGGSGGGGPSGDPNNGGNTPFVPDGPERGSYTVPSPMDSLAHYQWHLDNKGLKFYTQVTNTAGEDINHQSVRTDAWSGHGILVAVSDNGTESSHPDLFSNVLSQYERNYASDDPSAWHASASPTGTDASSAHGTAVAGLIAAIDGNNEGGIGVAPRSKLGVFKYVGTGGNLNKAIDQADGPFHIFNYSYGRSSCAFIDLPQSLIDQYKYGVESLRNGKGAIYVKAAGNEYISGLDDCVDGAQGKYYGNANLEEEHSFPYMIVVGAFNADGISASYSTPGSSLWIVAPGGEFGVDRAAIITTDLVGCDSGMAATDTSYTTFDKGVPENGDCSYTNTMNGSSAATPIISGVAALILEANPNLTWREVKHVMARTARKIDPNRNATPHPQGANLQNHTYQDAWLTNSAGYHFHNWYGFGAVDAAAAVQMAQSYSTPLPQLQETNWSNTRTGLNLSIPDSSSTGISDSMYVSTELTIEAVQVKITLDHSYTGDLGVELTSPSGMKSILMNINSNILETNLTDALLLSNAFYGESSKGTWTLKVIDGAPADTGTLKGWKLNFFGHSRTSGNFLAKSSNSEQATQSTKTNKSNAFRNSGKIDLSLTGKKTKKSTWTKARLDQSTKTYTFELKFKSKVTTQATSPDIKILDSVIDENGNLLTLIKKTDGIYFGGKALDHNAIRVPWYMSEDKYALYTGSKLLLNEHSYSISNLESKLFQSNEGWSYFTKDGHRVDLKKDGSTSITTSKDGLNGFTTGTDHIEYWNYKTKTFKIGDSEEVNFGINFKQIEVIKIGEEKIILGIDDKSMKFIKYNTGKYQVFTPSGLDYLKHAEIKQTLVLDNVLHILYDSDGNYWHIGIELYEE